MAVPDASKRDDQDVEAISEEAEVAEEHVPDNAQEEPPVARAKSVYMSIADRIKAVNLSSMVGKPVHQKAAAAEADGLSTNASHDERQFEDVYNDDDPDDRREHMTCSEITKVKCKECHVVIQMFGDSMAYELIAMFIIWLNIVATVAQTPNPPDNFVRDSEEEIWYYIDLATSIYFAVELVGKWVCYGIVYFYCTAPDRTWNWLDTFVVVVTMPSLVIDASSVSRAFDSLRVVRALRSLRFIAALRAITIIILRIGRTIFALVFWMFLAFMVWGVFLQASISDALDKRCAIPNQLQFVPPTTETFVAIWPPRTCASTAQCPKGTVCAGTAPMEGYISFRDFGWTALSLFQMATLSDWFVTDKFVGFSKGSEWTAWSITLIIVSLFLVMQVTSTTVLAFKQIRKEWKTSGFSQSPWAPISQSTIVREKYGLHRKVENFEDFVKDINRSELCSFLYAIATSTCTEIFILCVISIDAIFSASAYVGMPQGYADMLKIMEMLFLVIYTIEQAIKLAAHGYKYFYDKGLMVWNTSDFAITVLGLSALFTDTVGEVLFLRIFRLFRAFRLLRMFRTWRQVCVLMNGAMSSYKVLRNSFLFYLFCTWVTSVLLQQLFGNKAQDFPVNYHSLEPYVGAFTHSLPNNFDTIGKAILTTFRVQTADHWQVVMFSCMRISSTSMYLAPFLFVFIIWSCYWILRALFVAAILENLDLKHDLLLHTERKLKDIQAQRERAFNKRALGKDVSEEEDSPLRPLLGKYVKTPYSMMYFAPDHPVRMFCKRHVLSPAYRFTLAAIVLTVSIGGLVLRWENPDRYNTRYTTRQDHNETLDYVLAIMELTITVILLLELIMKCIAFGVINTAQDWTKDWPNPNPSEASESETEQLQQLAEDGDPEAGGVPNRQCVSDHRDQTTFVCVPEDPFDEALSAPEEEEDRPAAREPALIQLWNKLFGSGAGAPHDAGQAAVDAAKKELNAAAEERQKAEAMPEGPKKQAALQAAKARERKALEGFAAANKLRAELAAAQKELNTAVAERKMLEKMEGPGKEAALKHARDREEKAQAAVAEAEAALKAATAPPGDPQAAVLVEDELAPGIVKYHPPEATPPPAAGLASQSDATGGAAVRDVPGGMSGAEAATPQEEQTERAGAAQAPRSASATASQAGTGAGNGTVPWPPQSAQDDDNFVQPSLGEAKRRSTKLLVLEEVENDPTWEEKLKEDDSRSSAALWLPLALTTNSQEIMDSDRGPHLVGKYARDLIQEAVGAGFDKDLHQEENVEWLARHRGLSALGSSEEGVLDGQSVANGEDLGRRKSIITLKREDLARSGAMEVPYFRNGWNYMDFAILLVNLSATIAFWSTLDEAQDEMFTIGSSAGRVADLGQAVVLLRIIDLNYSIKGSFEKVKVGLAPALSALLVFFINCFLFGIAFLQVFMDEDGNSNVKYCEDLQTATYEDCTGLFNGPLGFQKPKAWLSPRMNFDDVGEAIVSALSISTIDQWTEVLMVSMSATARWQESSALNEWGSWGFSFLAIALVFIGYFFLLQLFNVCVISCFQDYCTDDRLLHMEHMRRMVKYSVPQPRPPRPINRIRQVCYDIANSETLLIAGAVTTLVDVGVLLTDPEGWTIDNTDDGWHSVAYIMISVIYVGELLIRLVGSGLWYFFFLDVPQGMFKISASCACRYSELNLLNILDLGMVIITAIGFFVEEARMYRALRIFRLIRIIRTGMIFKRYRWLLSLRTVCIATYSALFQCGWYFLFLIVCTLIYAQFGQDCFYGVKYGDAIGDRSNFRTVSGSVYCLLEVMSGKWYLLYKDCSLAAPKCTVGLDCGSFMALPYFVSYYILAHLFLLQIFAGILVENFDWVHSMSHTKTGIDNTAFLTYQMYHDFEELWIKYDIAATGMLPLSKLRPFMIELGPPLGALDDESLPSSPNHKVEGTTGAAENLDRTLQAMAWAMANAHLPPGQMSFQIVFTLLVNRILGVSTFEADYDKACHSGVVGTFAARTNLAIVKAGTVTQPVHSNSAYRQYDILETEVLGLIHGMASAGNEERKEWIEQQLEECSRLKVVSEGERINTDKVYRQLQHIRAVIGRLQVSPLQEVTENMIYQISTIEAKIKIALQEFEASNPEAPPADVFDAVPEFDVEGQASAGGDERACGVF